MADFGIALTGERQVAVKFDQFPKAAHDAILERMRAITADLHSRVLAAVPKDTGQLSQQIQAFVDDKGEKITSKVKVLPVSEGGQSLSVFMGKAMALEYGAHAATKVAAHISTLNHFFGRAVEPREVFVKAYRRQVNIPEFEYLRRSLAAVKDKAVSEIQGAVEQAANQSP